MAAFLVPLDGVRREEMQEWLDMLAELTFTGTSHDTYFDLGTQVIVSAIIDDSMFTSVIAGMLLGWRVIAAAGKYYVIYYVIYKFI